MAARPGPSTAGVGGPAARSAPRRAALVARTACLQSNAKPDSMRTDARSLGQRALKCPLLPLGARPRPL
jgi:hypothetical protein